MKTIINPQAQPPYTPKPFGRLPIYRLVRSKISDIEYRTAILAGLKREYHKSPNSKISASMWQTGTGLSFMFPWHDTPEGGDWWAKVCMRLEELEWS